ncbi:MAG: polysaccharide lyase [Verrucomicrobiaceae bacterium]|nr:polysaccharide lyase [Verrucomicrobiaceae bacterium]
METRSIYSGIFLAVLVSLVGARADTIVFNADYESGALDSGITGLDATQATAPDAALVSTAYARSGTYSIYHKVTLDDPAYVSAGKPRSESDTSGVSSTLYRSGDHAIYTFSVLLKDWQDWSSGATPIDIVWQFKHTNGSPDAFVGVRRNQLVLRYGASDQVVLVNDIRPFDNKWIDLKFDIFWSDLTNGYIKAWVSANGAPLTRVANIANYATYSGGTGNFGYLKWGLYRPDSTSANGAVMTREAHHDNISVTVVPPPLRMDFQSGQYTLAWPNPSPGFLLQTSPDLSAWSNVTTQSVVVGSENQVTVPASEERGFFRLIRP